MPHEFTKWTLDPVFFEDICAVDRFKRLYTEITEILHSDIPALLPNQEVPYADLSSSMKPLQKCLQTIIILMAP